METYILSAVLYLIVIINTSAKIRNGYIDAEGARKSLVRIHALIKNDKSLSFLQKQSMKNTIERLVGYIIYHDFTERQLHQFRIICPELYFEIDSLTDRKGRNVDVYVKFVPEHEMPRGVVGRANINHDTLDADLYVSAYGNASVAVQVAAGHHSLRVLAHEFGHVKYQAGHLADYTVFHMRRYQNNGNGRSGFGHSDRDASGQNAAAFTNRFNKSYTSYDKEYKRKKSYMSQLSQIERAIKHLYKN